MAPQERDLGAGSRTSAASGWKTRNFTQRDVQSDTSTRQADPVDLVLHGWTTTGIFILKWDQRRVSVPLAATAESKHCESALRPRKQNSRRLRAPLAGSRRLTSCPVSASLNIVSSFCLVFFTPKSWRY